MDGEFHDYVVKKIGANRFLAGFPVTYMKENEVVRAVVSRTMFFN